MHCDTAGVQLYIHYDLSLAVKICQCMRSSSASQKDCRPVAVKLMESYHLLDKVKAIILTMSSAVIFQLSK